MMSFRSSRIFLLNIFFRSSRMLLIKHEIFSGTATHTKICSEAAAKISTVAAQNMHTLREDFYNLSMVMKRSIMVIKPKALHVPWPMLLSHRPVQASYHRLCSGLSYSYCPGTPCTSHSQTTFAPCILFHHQTGKSFNHQT